MAADASGEDFSALSAPSSFRGVFNGDSSVVSGDVSDSRCTVERLDEQTFRADSGLHYLLLQLAQSTFFRIFKVDLSKSCPYWGGAAATCSQPDCAVFPCRDDEVPASWRTASDASRGASANNPLGSLDRSRGGNDGALLAFVPYALDDRDAWTAQDGDASSEYVDLVSNPERYTGYQGRDVWDAVYRENCFKPIACAGGDGGGDARAGAHANATAPAGAAAPLGAGTARLAFKEERIFYRLVSGLHTSINIHISKQYLQPDGTWGANLAMYRERVHEHPERLRNLYFTYALVLRATSKAAPRLLHDIDYTTGNATEDARTRRLVERLFESPLLRPDSPMCEETFDEHEGVCDARLQQFRAHFRNISTVLDCVGCEKCRLWGKLQFLGAGTALKVLFSADGGDGASQVELKRNEVVALLNVLKNLSLSMRTVHELQWALFEWHARRRRWIRRGVAAVIALVVLGRGVQRVRRAYTRIVPDRRRAQKRDASAGNAAAVANGATAKKAM